MINLQFYFTDSTTGFLVSTSFLYLIINIFSCCVSILFLFYKQFWCISFILSSFYYTLLSNNFQNTSITCVCGCACRAVYTCCLTSLEVGEQHSKAGSVLPPLAASMQELNSGFSLYGKHLLQLAYLDDSINILAKLLIYCTICSYARKYI